MQLKDVEDFYPLSPLQQGLLFHSVAEPSSRLYCNQSFLTLRGELDAEAFRRAWQRAVDRHPVLRTFFVWEGVAKPAQVVRPRVVVPFEVLDWRGLAPSEREVRFDVLRRTDLERGFRLSTAPLLRLVLIRTEHASHELLFTFHHILMDGWSLFRVLREVFEDYDAAVAGRDVSHAVARPYRDYIAWLHHQSLERAETFWRRALAGFTAPTELPSDLPGLPGTDGAQHFDVRVGFVSEETTAALQALAGAQRLTLNTILQGAWALLLARTSGEDDVLFGTVVAGRPAGLEGVEDMVGLFINTLPVRARIDPRAPLSGWLQRLQAEQAEMREYEYSPLTEVQGWSDVPGGVRLFESIFLFENYRKDASLEEVCRTLEVSDVRWFERHSYSLAAVAIPGPRLSLRLIYATEHFSATAVERVLGHWRVLLEGIVGDPGARLADLSILAPEERRVLVEEWSGTRTDYPRDRCIHELFEEQVRRSPDAIAVTFGSGGLSFGELNRRANRLGHHLRRLGVGPDVGVGLCAERSLEMVVALLAILKAGGAYVFIDPDYPPERVAFMLAESQAHVLLTEERLAASLPKVGARVIRLDADRDACAAESDLDPENLTVPENLAYVVFTSGSTGRPKGTCIPHRAVVRLVRDTDFAVMTGEDVFLQFAPISFDASTLELWGSLLNGARLALFPAGKASLEDLGRVVREEGVTILWLTAGLFHQMIERHAEGLVGVRQLLAGGDVLSAAHVKRALDELPGCTVINGYGPTENTTFTCCHRMTESAGLAQTVPIGSPIANTTVYLLDRRMEPVPIGVPGELYTGGDGLARGYLGHPELTAERFVPDPFGPPGSRLYRTGDRARRLADGTIEFLGRDDFQVKIRGFRVEPGEIEVALADHPAVRNAVVVAREDAGAEKRLVAYLLCTDGSGPRTEDLRAFLEERLPTHMVPSAFVVLDAFPLTPNGKVDRRALPEPAVHRSGLATTFAAPEADTELRIAAVWREVLGLPEVGVHDNFFDLGGHSLHLIRVHEKLAQEVGRAVSMVDLFKYPTIRALAAHLEDGLGEAQTPEGAHERVQAGKERLRELRQRRRRS